MTNQASPTNISQHPFYQAYNRKSQGVNLKGKHIRQFRKDFIEASNYRSGMSVLELGCGNGLFLRFLTNQGVKDFIGVDGDPRIIEEIPTELVPFIHIYDFDDFFISEVANRRVDGLVLFDVLEHFTPNDAASLLKSVSNLLSKDGRIVIRVPNMASPLALGVQYNDVTHQTAFSPGSIRQVASVAELETVAFQAQAYSSRYKEIRERIFTTVVSWFLATPPTIWSPNLIAILKKKT
jgi:cyclopropane fatty-acyl-phospholipid synthase-like methyltransferase